MTYNVWLTKEQTQQLLDDGGPISVTVEVSCGTCGESEEVEIMVWNNDD